VEARVQEVYEKLLEENDIINPDMLRTIPGHQAILKNMHHPIKVYSN
jgi:hypothetical protein